MYRMKGNRDSSGATASHIPVDIVPSAFKAPAPGKSRHGRRWLVAGVAGALALLAAGGFLAIALLRSDDSSMSVSATIEATAISAATIEPSFATVSGLLQSPSAGPGMASPATTPILPTPTRPGATPAPSPTPTAVASPASATVSPSAVQPQRVRYVVQPGDACDLLRARFGFAPARWEDFIEAMAALSGRAGAAACAFSPGDVLCIPAPADIDAIPSLRRDDACLASP